MSTPVRPPEEATHEAIRHLARGTAAADALRFLDQLGPGSGNYTEERHAILGNPSVDEFFAEVRRREALRVAARDA
jgi:hypothetical protein